jgi:PadR family transcriptional regulator PadR
MKASGENQQRWVTQLRKGLLDFCLLTALRREDGYGYLIVQRLKRIEGLTMAEGTVYPILQRLYREGSLSTYHKPSENGPPRKWFKLTARGRKRLAAMDDQWRSLCEGVAQLRAEGLPNNNEKRNRT